MVGAHTTNPTRGVMKAIPTSGMAFLRLLWSGVSKINLTFWSALVG
jgi:hypothetical protein